jgi:hypothetical protein
MKSGAEPHKALLPRGAALFDRIDYRLIETPEANDRLYLMRYRAYLRAVRVAARHRSLRRSAQYLEFRDLR